MMNKAQSEASTGLRVAAGLCLGALVFATVRIIIGNAGESFMDFLRHMDGAPAQWILIPMPFAIFASLYVLITGRTPNLRASPIELNNSPDKPKGHGIGMAIVFALLVVILGAVAYALYFME